MEYTLRPFANIDDCSLKRVALPHQSVMRNSLTDLGFPIILRYYQIVKGDPSVTGFCAVSSSEEILGWVVGSPDPPARDARMQMSLFWFHKRMLYLAVTHPLVFLQALLSAFYASKQKLFPHTVEWTYIGVAPEVQGNGIGHALRNAFIDASRSMGYCSIERSVEKNSLKAFALFTKLDFAILRTFGEGHYERCRMERRLS